MSKLEEQKALPRRKLFRLLDDLEKGVIYARDIDGSGPQRDGSQTCTCTREIFGCSIHPNTRDEWIASQRASLVLTLATSEIRAAFARVRAAGYGQKSSAALASFDPLTCSLKTSQQSLLCGPDSMLSSLILPRWGSMRNGAVYELPMSEPLTPETDGFSWPTPSARDWKDTPGMATHTKDWNGWDRVRLDQLARVVYWREAGGRLSSRQSATTTPANVPAELTTATDAFALDRPRTVTNTRSKTDLCSADEKADAKPGALNPTWVEWLMGWPLAWTVSKHWATVKSQRKPRSRGES